MTARAARWVSNARIEAARGRDILAFAADAGARLKRITATEWSGPCPACGGRDRFAINTAKRVFSCRGGGGGGDVIALAQHLFGLGFDAALEHLAGGACPPLVHLPARPAPMLDETFGKGQRIARAREIWAASVEPRGTIAEFYLNSRALLLDADLAGSVLRFNPRCPWRDEDAGATICIPALIAVMRSITTNEITAVQRTGLSPEGLKLGRRMLGIAAGAAIKLDPDDEVLEGLHGGEGTETTMSGRQLGLRPAWALGSSGAIANLPVLGGVQCLTIFAEAGDASAAAIQACGERWSRAGREVIINRPRFGSDLNDALKMQGTK